MAIQDSGGRRGKRSPQYICPVPKEHCSGRNTGDGGRVHVSHDGVKKCQAHYYTAVKGYTKVGSRDFAPADGGPILVMSKKATRAKPGKSDRYMTRRPSEMLSW